MADLSQAALDNSTRLDAFTHRLTALADQWQQAQDSVQQIEHHVHADTQALLTHLETLEIRVHQAHDTVQTDVEALGHRLAEVSYQLEARQAQAELESHQTQSDLTVLEEALDGLLQEVDGAVQQAEDTLHGCAERAHGLTASLQELTAEAERHLHEHVDATLQQQRGDIECLSTTLEEHLHGQALPAFEQHTTEVRTHLEYAVQTLRETSRATLERTTGDTAGVLTRVSQGHSTQAQEVLRQVQTIAETLRRVSTLLQTGTGDVVKTTSLLADGAQAANTGVGIVIGLLRETEELLHRVSGL